MSMLTNIINNLVAWLAANEHRSWLLIVPMAIGIGLAEGHWRIAAGMFAYVVGNLVGMSILHASISRNIDRLMRGEADQ